MLTPEDVKVLDINSAYHGMPTSRLMVNAGRAVAEVARKRFAPKSVLVLAGPGNNGGDGCVAASELAAAGVSTTLLVARDPEELPPGDARGAYRRVDPSLLPIVIHRDAAALRGLLRSSDLVIDALLGIGQTGPLRDPIREIVVETNRSRKPVLSVDVPTGLGSRVALRPRVTVTFHDRKEGLSRAAAGQVLVKDIGIPAAAERIGPGDLTVHYPRNDPSTHKGQNGCVALFAGGAYPGAAILASTACLRAGADLVHLYTARLGAAAARAHSADLMVHPGRDEEILTAEDVPRFQEVAKEADVVVLGPGLGWAPTTLEAVRELLQWTQRRKMAVVLDAEALAVAGKHPRLLAGRPVLATPHPIEFKRLTGSPLPPGREATVAQQAARRLGVTILAKTHETVVTDGRRVRLNPQRPAWMTVGGCGDVLTGATSALVAKGLGPYRAACVGLALTSLAAVEAFEETSWGARASDLVARFGRVLRAWVPLEPGRPKRNVD